jgi:cell division protein FtsZ
MNGERPTKSLHLEWQGTPRIADGKEETRRARPVVMGVGEFGAKVVAKLDRLAAKTTHIAIVDMHSPQLSRCRAHRAGLHPGESNRRSDSIVHLPHQKGNRVESQRSLQKVLAGANVVFIAAGLKNEVEVALTKLVARTSKREHAVTLVFTAKSLGTGANQNHKDILRYSEIQEECDTLVLVDNSKLVGPGIVSYQNEGSEISCQIVASTIAELLGAVSTSNLINLDFKCFHDVLTSGGMASIGVGESSSLDRAKDAVQEALGNALSNTSFREATGAIIHVTGDNRLTVEEVNSVGDTIAGLVNEGVCVTWGANVNPNMSGKLRVTLLVTKEHPLKSTVSVGAIAPHLFNLEPYAESIKELSVDLDLYQLETY